MLTIRKIQLDLFSRPFQEAFVEKMLVRLRAEYSEKFENLDDQKLRDYIWRNIEDASLHGLEVEGVVARFIVLRCEYGEKFELAPDRIWAWKLLEDRELPDILRISLITDRFESRQQGRKIVKQSVCS